MIFKQIENVPSFLAGDKTILKELLHPKNDKVAIPYSLAHAEIEVGAASVPHILKSEELYYILEGSGEIIVAAENQLITKGDLVLVPAHAEQYVKNTGNTKLSFLVIVSPPWREDEEEIL